MALMHMDTGPKIEGNGKWYKELNKYHWFVLIVAALGWLFDTMDQQLFNLARVPAMNELLDVKNAVDKDAAMAKAREMGGYATSIFLIGWATGGLYFGVLGDRIGRVKTMTITILAYSLATGLSALSVSVWDFAFYRFLTGLGVGGEFAVGVALVAEVMPERARPHALGLLQALSAVGNVMAAMIGMGLAQVEEAGLIGSAWRWMFVVGALPAFLAIFIRRRLKEPERWQKSGVEVTKRGSYSELFGNPTLRRNAIVGLVLALSGVIGVWGLGFFSTDLSKYVFKTHFEGLKLTPDEVKSNVTYWSSIWMLMFNVGAFAGIAFFAKITSHLGRRPAFAICFLIAMAATAFTFWFLAKPSDCFWMAPIMGFGCLSVFGGYAIYFPELFPTHLRSTGTSFCYNIGRYLAAPGPIVLSLLTSRIFSEANGYAGADPWRYAGVTMCAVYLVGIAVLPFCPETKGKPLPE